MDGASAPNGPAPSWQADPFGRHEQRWWDGERWTEKVRSTGTTGIDPPGVVARPEHAWDNVPAKPITDATGPISYQSRNLPRMLVLSALVLLTILVIVVVGIATA
jgi:hypothetical protein